MSVTHNFLSDTTSTENRTYWKLEESFGEFILKIINKHTSEFLIRILYTSPNVKYDQSAAAASGDTCSFLANLFVKPQEPRACLLHHPTTASSLGFPSSERLSGSLLKLIIKFHCYHKNHPLDYNHSWKAHYFIIFPKANHSLCDVET